MITFANRDDYISFRHHNYAKKGHKEVALSEVGPRFEMRLFQVRLDLDAVHESVSTLDHHQAVHAHFFMSRGAGASH